MKIVLSTTVFFASMRMVLSYMNNYAKMRELVISVRLFGRISARGSHEKTLRKQPRKEFITP